MSEKKRPQNIGMDHCLCREANTCRLLIVNKTDVLPYFDCEKLIQGARMRNPDIDILFVSAKTGEGISQAADRIRKLFSSSDIPCRQ